MIAAIPAMLLARVFGSLLPPDARDGISGEDELTIAQARVSNERNKSMDAPADKTPDENDLGLNDKLAFPVSFEPADRSLLISVYVCGFLAPLVFFEQLSVTFGHDPRMSPAVRNSGGFALYVMWTLLVLAGIVLIGLLFYRRKQGLIVAAIPAFVMLSAMTVMSFALLFTGAIYDSFF